MKRAIKLLVVEDSEDDARMVVKVPHDAPSILHYFHTFPDATAVERFDHLVIDDPAAELTGTLGGRYRIQRELGRGGMARVYLAEDLKHGRDVAVKVIRPELAASLGRDRFLRLDALVL